MATPYLGMTGIKKVGTIKKGPVTTRGTTGTRTMITPRGAAVPSAHALHVTHLATLAGGIDINHPVLTAGTVPKPMVTRPKTVTTSAHDQHVAHVAHLAAIAKAGTASKAKTTSTTLDAHQLHVLHMQHLASIGGGAAVGGGGGASAGGGSTSGTGAGGVVGPISSTTGVGGTATSVSTSLLRIAEYAAIILFLIWAWRKGYIQAALKRAGKLGENSGNKIAKLGKGGKR